MLLLRRPTDLNTFNVVEANFYSSGFYARYNQFDTSYLKREVLDWLEEIEGEVYWELMAQDDFFVHVGLNRYVHDFRFVFYFRKASDAILFKLQWF